MLSISDPPPLEREMDHFTLTLNGGTLTVTMREDHASIDSARDRVQPLLKSWELDNALTYGPGAFRFVYQEGEVVDRNPRPPGSSRTISLSPGAFLITGGHATLTVGRRNYPEPPSTFVASPEVDLLWSRYERYLTGKEPLTTVAYFCLTIVEAQALGSRKKAAKMLGIKPEILSTLGSLVSNKGDAKTARKFPVSGVLQPHHPQEERWMEEVVRALIRRMGEYAAGGGPLKTLTVAHFPPLHSTVSSP